MKISFQSFKFKPHEYKNLQTLIKLLNIVNRYWLFGEKEDEGSGDNKVKRMRGWFPRPSAIEVIGNDMGQISHSKVD